MEPEELTVEWVETEGVVSRRGRISSGGNQRWIDPGIGGEESDWIRMPDRGRWYVYAFVVP